MATTNENVRINFITTADNRGAKSAAAQLGALERQASVLGRRLAAAFSIQQIGNFLKSSLQAYAQDQKSALLLANTMKNLFMTQDVKRVEDYIQKTEALTGILDDQLRPAFEKFLRVTFDASKSQELMNLALDVAAGTGKDLDTVVAALSKAYGGNTTALGKLGAGLTAADLKTGDFVTIQKKLAMLFKGDATTAANSVQGAMARLNATMDQAKEIVGKGLVEAFQTLAGPDGGIASAQTAITDFATATGDALVGMARIAKSSFDFINSGGKGLLGNLLNLNLGDTVIGRIIKTGKMGALANYGSKVRADEAKLNQTGALQLAMESNAAEKQRLELLAKQNAELAKQKKAAADKLALDKASNFLKRSERLFDNNAIQLAAALQGNLTEEDRKRVELKQTQLQLSDAIADKDAALASKLMDSITQQEKGLKSLGTTVSTLPEAPDLLAKTKASLAEILAQLEKVKQYSGGSMTPAGLIPSSMAPYVTNPELYAGIAAKGGTTINQDIKIEGSVTKENDLAANVASWLQDYTASGSEFILNRLNGQAIK